MRKIRRLTYRLTPLAILALSALARGDSFFATQVITYTPGPGVTAGVGFGIISRVLGGPRGGGLTAGSLDVLTLGVQGQLTLGFDTPGIQRRIVNQPGPDFIVFENAFYAGGNPATSFAELVFVEVSSDGVTFARFPTRSTNAGPLAPFATLNSNNVSGLAGAHAVFANVDTNTNNPFDPIAAGGDAFDLDALASDPLVTSGQVNLSAIRFIRLRDVLGDGSQLDAAGQPIYDPTGLNNSCDIDAVSIIHGCIAGDLDGNGAVDAADASALAQLLVQSSYQPCADLNADGRLDGSDIAALISLLMPL